MTISTAAGIISQVPTQFTRAKEGGDLFFFPSTVHKHSENNVDFEIRLCPALEQKPVLPTPRFETAPLLEAIKKKISDPFMPPYNTGLYIGEMKDELEENEYVVLLNKFAVVEGHFLLITKKFESQTSPLSPSDLVTTYRLLQESKKQGRNIFAFYNCGDNSGASQPHKHLQLIPCPDGDAPPIERLARTARLESPDKPFMISSLPHAHYILRLPQHLSTLASNSPTDLAQLETVLSGAFITLLDLVFSTLRHLEQDGSKPARPSYNAILTLDHLHLVPRFRESYSLSSSAPAPASHLEIASNKDDVVSVNSLGFAGMFLVKSQEQLEKVQKEGLARILTSVGCESGKWDDLVTGVVLD
jgi:ATP adenylyltransferase